MLRTASLSPLTADPAGHVTLRLSAGATLGETRRRMNRIATLDGGAVTNDSGYSEADRTIELRWAPTDADTDAAVARLVQTYSRLQVAVADAVYLAAPEVYIPGASESQLRLLVLSKLSA